MLTIHKQKILGRGGDSEQEFFTHPGGYGLTINLYMYFNSYGWFNIELTSLDKCLEFSRSFKMLVMMTNQTADHSHHEASSDDLVVDVGKYNDKLRIPYDTVENPLHGVQYISNNNVKLQILSLSNNHD